jgi:hypothetical protein
MLLGGAAASSELLLGDNTTDMLTLPGSVLDGVADFTFSAWLRIDVLRGENHQILSAANAVEDNVIGIWYREATDEWVFGEDDDSYEFGTDARIEDGQWHHVVVTRAGSSAQMYFDGLPLGSAVSVPGDVLDVDPNGLVFGQDQDMVGGGFEADEAWAGAMDNLRLYDRAVSGTEAQSLAEEQR